MLLRIQWGETLSFRGRTTSDAERQQRPGHQQRQGQEVQTGQQQRRQIVEEEWRIPVAETDGHGGHGAAHSNDGDGGAGQPETGTVRTDSRMRRRVRLLRLEEWRQWLSEESDDSRLESGAR